MKKPSRRKALSYYLWPVACLLLLAVCGALLAIFVNSGDSLSQKAMESGQRLTVTLSDGTVTGLPLMTEKEALPKEVADEPVIDGAVAGAFSSETDSDSLPSSIDKAEAETDNKATPSEEKQHTASPSTEVSKSEPEEEFSYSEVVEPEPETVKHSTAAAISKDINQKTITDVSVTSGHPLPKAPLAKLVETTELGDLPKISESGKRPWEAYRKSFKKPAKTPIVSIIVTGLGLGRYTTEAAFTLPENFTFSFSPYAREVSLWGNHARDIGHEVLLDLPMQPADYPATDPGPYALLNSIKVSDNRDRLRWIMTRFSGYIGFLASRNAAVPEPVMLSAMADIGGRGLLFIDIEGTAADSMGSQKAEMGLKDITASGMIDEKLSQRAIKKQLNQLVEEAKKHGHAIGVARPYPITIESLIKWEKTLKKQGVILAPVSAIAHEIG